MKFSLLSKIYLILCGVFFIFILIATPIPLAGGGGHFTVYDKIFHFFLFGGLAVGVNWLFLDQKKMSRFSLGLLIFILVLFYILAAEYIQQFIPTRGPSGWDVLGGVAGAFFGIIFVNSYQD